MKNSVLSMILFVRFLYLRDGLVLFVGRCSQLSLGGGNSGSLQIFRCRYVDQLARPTLESRIAEILFSINRIEKIHVKRFPGEFSTSKS